MKKRRRISFIETEANDIVQNSKKYLCSKCWRVFGGDTIGMKKCERDSKKHKFYLLDRKAKTGGEEMKRYPRVKTWKNKVLVVVVLDKGGEETLDWYSVKEIRQILKEQEEE